MFFAVFLFISTHISLDLLFLGSAETYIKRGGGLNGHLMACCVRNIRTKNYQNLIIGFQVTVKNVGMFLGTQCSNLNNKDKTNLAISGIVSFLLAR